MTYQEKRIYVSLLTAIIVLAIYSNYMYDMYLAGDFNGTDASALVGQSTFWLIGGSIIVSIIVQILFTIGYAIVMRDSDISEYKSDERDKQIELKAMQISFVIFSIGFIISMAFLAYGWLPYIIFLIITLSMFICNIAGDLVKLVYYRRGF